MNEKVQSVALNSANVRYNNAVDTEKVFDIEVNVSIRGNVVGSFDGGVVKKDSMVIASFSMYGENNLSISFQNVTDPMEMCSILNAVSEFIENVKADVQAAEIKF